MHSPNFILADSKPVLVMFADASGTAYGTKCYFNWETPEGPRQSSLLCAKAKPCPKRPPLLTIPRAELCAAGIGIRLVKSVLEQTTYDLDRVILLSDSSVVLG